MNEETDVINKDKHNGLSKGVILLIIIILFNPYSLYFFQLLSGLGLSHLQEFFNNSKCKTIDKDSMIKQASQNDFNERFVIPCASSRGWLNDKAFALNMVKYHGYTFGFISPELQNDRDLVLEALRGGANIYLGNFKNDRELVLEAVKKNGKFLEDASPELKNDREVLSEAMKNYPWALEYASPELQNDREVVIAAIKRDWGNIKYASPELKNDRDIALEAVKGSPYAVEYLGQQLKDDPEIIKLSKK